MAPNRGDEAPHDTGEYIRLNLWGGISILRPISRRRSTAACLFSGVPPQPHFQFSAWFASEAEAVKGTGLTEDCGSSDTAPWVLIL